MRYWIHIGVVIAVLGMVLLPVTPTRAQDSALERVRAAYQAYQSWSTYQVQGDETARYALVINGESAYRWQTQERAVTLSGWYDVGGSQALLAFSTQIQESTDTGEQRTQTTWTVSLDTALTGSGTFWRGSYSAEPDDGFSLPGEWQPFTAADAAQSRPLADLALDRYLGPDPFIQDYEAWLAAAKTINGPQVFNLDKTTTGDLYVLEINLADVPDVLAGRFRDLTDGPDASVTNRDTLLQSLTENSTLYWGVVLDPNTGQLMAQYFALELSADLGADALAAPYTSLTIELSDNQNVLFSAVNEPVDTTGLPQ